MKRKKQILAELADARREIIGLKEDQNEREKELRRITAQRDYALDELTKVMLSLKKDREMLEALNDEIVGIMAAFRHFVTESEKRSRNHEKRQI